MKQAPVRLLPVLLAVVAGFAAVFAVPATGAELKIGMVNIQRLERESAPSERAQKRLEKEFAGRSAELQRMEKQFKDLQTQLERDGMTMSESDRRNKEADLAKVSRDFQRLQREFREDFNVRRNEEFQGLIERTTKAIRQVAEAEKFDLILQEAVYVSPRLDITDKVLKILATDK
ncbi:MAG: OmpH family outer membrane protein [Burkholderiales bacterium]